MFYHILAYFSRTCIFTISTADEAVAVSDAIQHVPCRQGVARDAVIKKYARTAPRVVYCYRSAIPAGGRCAIKSILVDFNSSVSTGIWSAPQIVHSNTTVDYRIVPEDISTGKFGIYYVAINCWKIEF